MTVDKSVVDRIVHAARSYQLTDLTDALGEQLLDELAESVAWTRESRDEPFVDVPDYTFEPYATTPGQAARALTTYLAEASAHPSWATSDARDLCFRLAVALLADIPGFND